MAIPNAEEFLVPALPFLISGESPTGRPNRVQKTEEAIDKTREHWTRLYRPDVLVGRGSQNLPLLAAACGLGITFEQDDARHGELLDAWLRYAGGLWWAEEPGSRNIYGSWITTSILAAYAFAKKAERDDVVEGLRKLIRSTATILALGAGWQKQSGTFAGYPVTICGSRSTVVSKRQTEFGRSRKDENGRCFRPNFLFGHALNGLLVGLLDGTRPGKWEGDVLKACVSRTGVNPLLALLPEERALLTSLVEVRSPEQVSADDLETVRQWLEEGPRPRPPLHLIKTVEGTATVCRRGVNPGSTNPMYAYVWWATERPASSWLRFYDWSAENKQIDCLFVDDPGTRSQGRLGIAELDMENRTVKARRKTSEQFFNDESLTFETGWKEASLPGGEVLWHFRLTKNKAKIMPNPGRDAVVPA